MHVFARSLIVVFLACATLARAEMPFTSKSFHEASNAARRANKLVMTTFHTAWCINCKTLAAKTYKDRRILDWIDKHAVPTSINAETNRPLASRFGVKTYPTIVFTTPDGQEVYRIEGYLPPDRFLVAAQRAGKIGDNIVAAERALTAAGANKPDARITYAIALLDNSLTEPALAALLWCYDKGADHDHAFAGLGRSKVLSNIAKLAETYPPAINALRDRRDALRELLLADKAGFYDALDFAILNRRDGRASDTLALYDRIRKERPLSPSVRFLRDRVFDELRAAHRYAEISGATDIGAKVARILRRHQSATTTAPANVPKAERASFLQTQRVLLIRDVANYYEVLVGLGDEEAAARLAEELLRVTQSADAYRALAESGLRTSKPTAENLDQARRAFDLSERKDARTVSTLVRILAIRDDIDSAITMLDEVIGNAVDAESRQTLADLRTELAAARRGVKGSG